MNNVWGVGLDTCCLVQVVVRGCLEEGIGVGLGPPPRLGRRVQHVNGTVVSECVKPCAKGRYVCHCSVTQQCDSSMCHCVCSVVHFIKPK